VNVRVLPAPPGVKPPGLFVTEPKVRSASSVSVSTTGAVVGPLLTTRVTV